MLETLYELMGLVFVLSTMASMGLGLRVVDVTDPMRNRRLVGIAVLANFLVVLLLAILTTIASIFWILYIGYVLAVLVPSLAVAIRRLHDSNKTGWFLLLGLIPFVGAIILLVFYIMEGTNGPNDYGVAAEPAVN